MNKRPSNVSYKKNLTIKISLQQIPTTVLETGINQSCFSSFRFLLLLLTYENCYELKFENEEFFEIKVKITAKCWLSSSEFSVHNSASLQLSIWKCDSKIKVKWKINSKRVFLSGLSLFQFYSMGAKSSKQKDLLDGSAWLRTVVQHRQVSTIRIVV